MADDQPTTEQDATATSSALPPSEESPLSVGSEADAFAERPEAFVGAAFAGGLALARSIRRRAR